MDTILYRDVIFCIFNHMGKTEARVFIIVSKTMNKLICEWLQQHETKGLDHPVMQQHCWNCMRRVGNSEVICGCSHSLCQLACELEHAKNRDCITRFEMFRVEEDAKPTYSWKQGMRIINRFIISKPHLKRHGIFEALPSFRLNKTPSIEVMFVPVYHGNTKLHTVYSTDRDFWKDSSICTVTLYYQDSSVILRPENLKWETTEYIKFLETKGIILREWGCQSLTIHVQLVKTLLNLTKEFIKIHRKRLSSDLFQAPKQRPFIPLFRQDEDDE